MSLKLRELPEKLTNTHMQPRMQQYKGQYEGDKGQYEGEVYAQHGDDDFHGDSDDIGGLGGSSGFSEAEFDIDLEEDVEYATPREFKIIIHNDHYTAMDFVVKILTMVFHKSTQEAEALMLIVHKKGQAVVGTYAREVAESKIRDVEKMAKEKHYPLRLSMEEN